METLSGEHLDSWNHKLPACHSEKHSCREDIYILKIGLFFLSICTVEMQRNVRQQTWERFSNTARRYLPLGSWLVHGHSNESTLHTYPECRIHRHIKQFKYFMPSVGNRNLQWNTNHNGIYYKCEIDFTHWSVFQQ